MPNKDKLLFLITAFIVLCAVYWSTLVYCYALWDDYTLLTDFGDQKSLISELISERRHFIAMSAFGRPLQELWMRVAFLFADQICEVKYIRLVALISLLGLSYFLYCTFVAYKWPALEAGCLSIFICTLPSFAVPVGWVSVSQCIVGVLCGLLSGRFALRAEHPSARKFLILSFLLLFCALSLYQSSAMSFWLYIGIYFFNPQQKKIKALASFFRLFAIFTITVFVYWVIYKLYLHYLLETYAWLDGFQKRSSLALSIEKIDWFFRQILPVAGSLSYIKISWPLTILVLSIGFSGAYFVSRRQQNKAYLLIWPSLLPLAVLPNFPVAENAVNYRILLTLAPLLAYSFFFGIYMLSDWLRAARIRQLIFIFFTLVSAVITQHNLHRHIVSLQHKEMAAIKAHILANYNSDIACTLIIPPPFQNTIKGVLPTIEYGMYTSAFSGTLFNTRIYIQLIFENFGYQLLPTVHSCNRWDEAQNCLSIEEYPSCLILNIRDLISDLKH